MNFYAYAIKLVFKVLYENTSRQGVCLQSVTCLESVFSKEKTDNSAILIRIAYFLKEKDLIEEVYQSERIPPEYKFRYQLSIKGALFYEKWRNVASGFWEFE